MQVSLLSWTEVLEALPRSRRASGAIDLLVVDVRDPTVGELLKAFPLNRIKPSLIYFRTAAGHGLRRHLLEHGYQVSAHWETSSWGEHTIAWRADRCHATDIPGTPWQSAVDHLASLSLAPKNPAL
jgi:hypothetical protein